jgi:heat shock protein HtpX
MAGAARDRDAGNRQIDLKGTPQMTASTMQLTTRLRTWALVGALTGLLIAFGALLGGSWLWLFVFFAVAMNAVGYFRSDTIALRAARAKPLEEAAAPQLHAIARDLAARARIPVPRLYVMPGEQCNAFATGRDPEHAAVAVTEGLLTRLEPDHVRAVVAHEFAHIRNHDILVSSIAAMVAGAISAATAFLQLSFLFGGSEDDDGPLGALGAIAVMILAPIGALLLQLGVSRQREYLADATAAEMLGDGRPLADALQEIAGDRADPLDVPAATAPMYILNPLRGDQVAKLFSTHPPVRDRVRRLRAYGDHARRREARAVAA